MLEFEWDLDFERPLGRVFELRIEPSLLRASQGGKRVMVLLDVTVKVENINKE